MMPETGMTRRRWAIFALRMALAILGVALLYVLLLRPDDAAWQRLQQGEALRVALDPSFPPFDTVDANGRVAGFDVDLAREIGQRLGVEVAFLPIAFDGLADAVMAGRADAVISAFPRDERLSEDVRYSRPYFEAGLIVVTRAEDAPLDAEQLAPVNVAVAWGGQGDAWARAHNLTHIQRTDTPDEALQAVLDRRADAAIVDAVTAALFPQPGLRMQSPPLVSDPYVIVLPRQAPRLAEAIDAALTDLLQDGSWDALARKYFPNPPFKP